MTFETSISIPRAAAVCCVSCVGFPTAKTVVEADYWYDSPGPLFDAQMLAFTHFTLFLVKLQPMTMVIYIYIILYVYSIYNLPCATEILVLKIKLTLCNHKPMLSSGYTFFAHKRNNTTNKKSS